MPVNAHSTDNDDTNGFSLTPPRDNPRSWGAVPVNEDGPWLDYSPSSTQPGPTRRANGQTEHGPWEDYARKKSPQESELNFDNAPELDFDQLEDAPWVKSDQKYSALQSAYEGAKAGITANFSDELEAAGKASQLGKYVPGFDFAKSAVRSLPFAGAAENGLKSLVGIGRLAYEHATGQLGEASKIYDQAVRGARARQAAMQEQQPVAYGAGELGGSGASLLLAPEAKAATWGSRALQAGKAGAGYGALSGAGEGENLTSRAENAGIGGLGGGVGAAGAVPIAGLAERAIAGAARPIAGAVRGWWDPEAEAARRVGTALERDYKNVQTGNASGLTPPEYMAARAEGQPVIIGDLGGSTTKALMRSVANTSPEGRDILESALNERFRSQNERAGATIRNLVAGGANAAKTRTQLEAEYQLERGGAYKAAYDAGDRPIRSDKLEQLKGSPAVVTAMRDAVQRGQDRTIAEGHVGAFNPGVNVTPDGRVVFNKGATGLPAYPNLQFWDYTYRGLRDSASAAARAGRNDEAGALGTLAGNLRAELDRLVPQYAKARGVASSFFGGENALDAGAKAVNYKGDLAPLKQTLAGMKPAEREMFAESYADALASRIEAMPDRSDVTRRLFNSPQERAKIDAVFGPWGAQNLQAFIRRENIYDAARKAVSGNSTTVRQLVELGLAHGVKALGTGTAGSLLGGYFGGTQGALEGFGLGAAGKFGLPVAKAVGERAAGYVDRNVARRVAELLTSDDPAKLQRGLQMVASNKRIAAGLRAIEDRLTSAVSAREIPRAVGLPGAVTAQANDDTGGFSLVKPPELPDAPWIKQKAQSLSQTASAPQRRTGGRVLKKLTHTEAHYHKGPSPTGSHCSVCVHYIKGLAPRCSLVHDPIRPDDGCKKFSPQREPSYMRYLRNIPATQLGYPGNA